MRTVTWAAAKATLLRVPGDAVTGEADDGDGDEHAGGDEAGCGRP